MADPANSRSPGRSSDEEPGRPASETWVRRIVLALGLVVIAVIVYGILAAALPRWWAQRVGDQVDGRMTVGVFWGLFYGFVFSFVPVMVAWQARRSFLRWPWRLAVVVVAIVLAAPNWLTLAISWGDNSAADAGWITMVNEAPGFQWATFFGVLAGVLAAVALIAVLAAARRRKREVTSLKGRLAQQDTPPAAGPTKDHHREEPHA